MNIKSLPLNILLWFVGLPVAMKVLSELEVHGLGDEHRLYNLALVGIYYLFFTAWAFIIYKNIIYKAHKTFLTNALGFIVYFLLMGLSAAFVIFILFWIIAIQTGTAP